MQTTYTSIHIHSPAHLIPNCAIIVLPCQLFTCPLSLLPAPDIALKLPRYRNHFYRSFGALSSLPPYRKRWRLSCSRREDTSLESVSYESVDDDIPQVVNSEFDQPNNAKSDLVFHLKKPFHAVLHIEPWTVPWTVRTIVQVMLLWIASFWLVGSWIIPFLAHSAGFRKESLTYQGLALFSLLTDVAGGIAGVAILHHRLAKFFPLPSNWFKFSLGGKWHFDVGLCCIMFPLINQLSQVNLNLFPFLPSTPVTVSTVGQSIVVRDPVAMTLYAILVSVCAPIWAEIIFRGFLLPSLTRYMPVWGSILLSSIAFALAHFSLQRMLPLLFLGVLLGTIFVRSRNLLAPMLLHGLWNAYVFLDLMK